MKEIATKIVVIGGSDGPTSVCVLKNDKGHLTIKQKIYKLRYNIRKAWVEKHIKAEPHSMDDVENYLKNVYGFTEIKPDSGKYKKEYMEMRVSFLMQYAPELLGEYAALPELEDEDAQSVQKFMAQVDLRQKAAENVPREIFDINLHIFEKNEADLRIRFTLEADYEYIGGSASGSKLKRFKEIERDIYKYYGVTQEDIDNQSPRYESLVKTLTVR